jgi:hypothetical protein
MLNAVRLGRSLTMQMASRHCVTFAARPLAACTRSRVGECGRAGPRAMHRVAAAAATVVCTQSPLRAAQVRRMSAAGAGEAVDLKVNAKPPHRV